MYNKYIIRKLMEIKIFIFFTKKTIISKYKQTTTEKKISLKKNYFVT